MQGFRKYSSVSDEKGKSNQVNLQVDSKVMHHVWLVAELQAIIFSYCMLDSLSSFARTSKALKDLALDSLWAHVHIKQLLRLLPVVSDVHPGVVCLSYFP